MSKIRQALDESAIVAITDPQGIIKQVNDRFCEISQYNRTELIGKNHRIINSGYHPKAFFKQMWTQILSGEKWEGEIRNRAKDGSYYWVHTHIIPFRDDAGQIQEFVSIRYDVTARKNSELNMQSLLDSHLDGLLIYDLSARIVWSNQTAQSQFPLLRSHESAAFEEILGAKAPVFELGEKQFAVGTGESEKWLETVTKNYNFRGRAAYLVSVRDMTEKIKSEGRLIQQDRLASIGIMASGLAHEIGTPLGIIRGRAEIISNVSEVPPSVRSGAEMIMQQIDRVSMLVRNLLKLARGESETALQKVHLNSLFSDIQDFLQHELAKAEIDLEILVPESSEVEAVYTSLFQVFLNLFVNSIHAIQERKKTSPGRGLISVSTQQDPGYLIVKVADNGTGMNDEQIRRIFTPFYTTKEIGQGTGLGLATSYKLVQSWGGFFTVASALGVGSTFELHLPKKMT